MASKNRPRPSAAPPLTHDELVSDLGHLLRRAGFGATLPALNALAPRGLKRVVNGLVDYESMPDNFVPPSAGSLELRDLTALKDLSSWWLKRMLTTSRPLQEKMTLFWHGHFATSIYKVHSTALMYQQNQLFRQNALGRFDDLLTGVYKDPAMLIWLDGYVNTKAAPNENWGREVMELFTLGRGNYTEDDVHACARAFTGWRVNRDTGSSFFVPRLHDDGIKTLLGQTGNWTSDDAVQILCNHPATGTFLATKLWRFFASDQPPTKAIATLAQTYYRSDHSIGEMVRTLFTMPEFYAPAVRLGHIKSPAEFVVTTLRLLGLQNFDTTRLPETLTFLGQMLFNPPNVGGWPGGTFWINASTMLGRFNFAASLTGDAGRQATPLDLGALVAATGAETMEELVDGVAALLGVALTPSTRNSLLQYMGRGSIDRPDLEIKARGLIHLTLVSPEYQAS